MKEFDLILEGGTVVRPEGRLKADVLIRGGRISGLLQDSRPLRSRRRVNCEGRILLPGLIDTHVHLGRYGQDFAADCRTESRAALTGGVTALLVFLIEEKSYLEVVPGRAGDVERESLIDMGFHLAIQNRAQREEIPLYARKLGATSLKFFMAYKGKDATYIRGVDDGFLCQGLQAVSAVPGAWAIIHPENMEVIEAWREGVESKGRRDGPAWSDSRPPMAEEDGVQRALLFAGRLGAPLVIPHLSIGSGVSLVAARKRAGQRVVLETCAHYLSLTKDLFLDSRGKVNPPLRERGDVEGLWGGLAAGDVDFIGSDHCPFKLSVKGEGVWTARPGLPGVATTLPVLLTEGVAKGRLTLEQLCRVGSLNAAKTFGLYPQKGVVAPGADADLVVVDPERKVKVTAKILNSNADYTPYEGFESQGWPVMTVVGGEVVQEEGESLPVSRRGRYLVRPLGSGALTGR
jgi:D-hydantoinase